MKLFFKFKSRKTSIKCLYKNSDIINTGAVHEIELDKFYFCSKLDSINHVVAYNKWWHFLIDEDWLYK